MSRTIRVAVAMICLISTGYVGLTTALPAQPIRAQDDGSARLVIHHRVCPRGYSGPLYFETCHDSPSPFVRFWADGPDRRTALSDEDGNAVFGELEPGAYDVAGGLHVDGVSYVIFCAPASAPGQELPIRRTNALPEAGFVIALETGSDVICDWFNVLPQRAARDPVRAFATFAFRLWLCPYRYEDHDFAEACQEAWHRHSVLLVGFDGVTAKWGAETDAQGLVAFQPSFDYPAFVVTTDLPAIMSHHEMDCVTTSGDTISVSYLRIGIEVGDVIDGQTVICDWYFVPFAGFDQDGLGNG